MKVIFLDFDGVLNSEKYLAACGSDGVVIDPSRMILLKQLVDATGAKIVLSTSWREHWSKEPTQCDSTGMLMNDIFSRQGLQIWDKVSQLRMTREAQIKNWLDRHPEVERFVVLDDGLLCAGYLEGRFVKTSNYFGGLNESDVQRACDILNG